MGCGASSQSSAVKDSNEAPSSAPVNKEQEFQKNSSDPSTAAPDSVKECSPRDPPSDPKAEEAPPVPAPAAEAAAPAEEAAAPAAEAAAPAAEAATPAAEAAAPAVKPSDDAAKITQKRHSAIRWGKPLAELEEIVGDDVESQDPQNGNFPIHLAAQNGHLEIVQWLIGKKCNVNAQNGTGTTALHMAVAYDFYFVVEALLAANADTTIKNQNGHEAITGIDGDKTGSDAWDSGLNMLVSATDATMAEAALAKIEANPEGVDKAKFAQVGMKKKKAIPDFPKDKFSELMKSL